MPKFMNLKNRYFTADLQLFAEGGDAGDDTGDGDDQDEDSDDDDADEDGEDEPKFTQADIDKAIARIIAKERARAERAAKRKEQKNKGSEKAEESEDVKARKKAEARAIKAETRAACFEAGVSKDAIDDVTALAHAYMEADEELDLEDAIEKVVKKYPQFKKDTVQQGDDEDGAKGKSWGQRQNRAPGKMSGVEQRFYELNPDLK